MNTVLLWGGEWWGPDADGPRRFADGAQAVEALAGHWGAERPELRVVFQPDDLAVAAVSCPNAGRVLLAAALGAEHPPLATGDHAWGYEPVFRQGEGYGTILHYETQPRLRELVAGLEARGFAVESVWPLGAFLPGLVAERSESGAVTVVALQAERGCAYRHAADGKREIRVWGNGAPAAAGEWLQPILAKDAGEPVLLVAGAEEAAALDARVPLADKPGVQLVSMRAALARRTVLPRRHPAQFLAPAPVVTANRLALVAGLALFAVAGVAAGRYAQECLALRAEAATREERKGALRAEIAHREKNREEIARLRTTIDAAAASGPSFAAALGKLCDRVPDGVVFTSLRIGTDGFAVHGEVRSADARPAWDRWVAGLAPWRVSAGGVPDAGGKFVVAGRFTS